jgi:hypothetical protein
MDAKMAAGYFSDAGALDPEQLAEAKGRGL